MQINLTGQNIDITEPLRTYVQTKLDRIKRHFDHVIDIHVVLDVEKIHRHAEATVRSGGKSIFADAKEHDMYAAIDALVDKLDRQIIKHKEKLKDHQHAVPHKTIHLS
jgi:putative sigma-54 modulation protein